MSKLHIPILIGTTRPARQSAVAARFIEQFGEGLDNITVELVDPTDFKFEGDGNDPEGKDPRYTEITARAAGFIIVVPEYNHSFPGSLKRMLDSELKNYIHKPVAFAGVSNGGWGGVRAIESLVNTVREMGLVASFTDIHFPRIQDLFDEDGNIIDAEPYQKRLEYFYDEVIWLAETLKNGRENVPSSYHQ